MPAEDSSIAHKPDGLRSVTRAFAILNLLARHPDGITAKAVAAQLGLKLGTTYHLLNTLAAAGYAARDGVGRQLRLGPRIAQLNAAFVGSVSPSPRLIPFVHALRHVTGETANLWCWWGDDVVAAAVVEGNLPDRIPAGYVGFVCAPHLMAVGKVLLAWAPPAKITASLARPELWHHPVAAPPDPVRLGDELATVRHSGYAIDRGSLHPDVCCVAAPIVGPAGEVAAALSVLVPRGRFAADEDVLTGTLLGIAQAARAVVGRVGATAPVSQPGSPDFQAAVDAALYAARDATCPRSLGSASPAAFRPRQAATKSGTREQRG